jgi:hypothetical protein
MIGRSKLEFPSPGLMWMGIAWRKLNEKKMKRDFVGVLEFFCWFSVISKKEEGRVYF